MLIGALEIVTDDGSIYTTAYRDGTMRMRVVTDEGATAEINMNIADCRDLVQIIREHLDRNKGE